VSADLWQQIVFWVIAVAMAFSAIRVVTTRNVILAALYLVGTLLGAAALYVLLYADLVPLGETTQHPDDVLTATRQSMRQLVVGPEVYLG
jgi:hypothetical protein